MKRQVGGLIIVLSMAVMSWVASAQIQPPTRINQRPPGFLGPSPPITQPVSGWSQPLPLLRQPVPGQPLMVLSRSMVPGLNRPPPIVTQPVPMPQMVPGVVQSSLAFR